MPEKSQLPSATLRKSAFWLRAANGATETCLAPSPLPPIVIAFRMEKAPGRAALRMVCRARSRPDSGPRPTAAAELFEVVTSPPLVPALSSTGAVNAQAFIPQ